jgi:predicted amidohydrolase
LYILPELFTIGMNRLRQCSKEEYAQVALQHDCVIQRTSDAIRGSNSAVVCGLLEWQAQGYYNTATVILGDGRVERYRQRIPATAAPAGRLLNVLAGVEYCEVTLWSQFRIGLMVCHDHWGAPDFFKHYKEQGTQAIVQISDSVTPPELRKKFSANCSKFGLPAIICNSAGQGQGGSCIIDREGHVVPLRTAKASAVECLSEEPSIAVGLLTVTPSVQSQTAKQL